MAQITQWFCNELLTMGFHHDTYTPPYDTLAVCLVTSVPPINTDLSQIQEVTAPEYARATIPFNTANWTLTGYREVGNANAVNYPAATSFWGDIEGYVVVTASAGSYASTQTVAVGRLVQPLKVISGVQPSLPINAVTFGLYDIP